MASPPITELTLRAREIFRLVVEDYLSSGQPVGSRTLALRADLNLSPASIRIISGPKPPSANASTGALPPASTRSAATSRGMNTFEPSALQSRART